MIKSIVSPKVEQFKLLLAQMEKERIYEVFDTKLAINSSVDYYKSKQI